MEEIMVFINERLPEIISFLLIFIGYLYQFFIKADVRKNYKLFHNITKNESKAFEGKLVDSEKRSKDLIDSTVKELNEAKAELEKEKQRIQKEHEELKTQLNSVIKACQVGFANSKELVKNGIAAQVMKIIPTETAVTIKKEGGEND